MVQTYTALATAAAVLVLQQQASSARKTFSVHELVEEINAEPGLLWTAGKVERFAGDVKSVLRPLLGVKADSWGKVQALPRHESKVRDEDIPESFDSEENWPHCSKVIGDIRDQSMCGCCWAFAGASAASDRWVGADGSYCSRVAGEDDSGCTHTSHPALFQPLHRHQRHDHPPAERPGCLLLRLL